jgi:hypothetical protein
VEPAASTTVEPAATAAHPLRHRGACHRECRRNRQRSNYFQICHFNSPS